MAETMFQDQVKQHFRVVASAWRFSVKYGVSSTIFSFPCPTFAVFLHVSYYIEYAVTLCFLSGTSTTSEFLQTDDNVLLIYLRSVTFYSFWNLK